jgi:hypothetical protein
MDAKWQKVWHPTRDTYVMVNEETGEIRDMDAKWQKVWHPTRDTYVMVNEETGEIRDMADKKNNKNYDNILDNIMEDYWETIKDIEEPRRKIPKKAPLEMSHRRAYVWV